MLAALLDLVAPHRCPGCRTRGIIVCARCLFSVQQPVVRHLDALEVRAAGRYGPTARALVVAHKERGGIALSAPLGRELARVAAPFQPDVVVPIPSRRRSRRERGFDHARRLASVAAAELGAVSVPALVLVRPTADQARLDALGRAANVRGAMAVDVRELSRLSGRQVVVVDDLVTTGATLTEAARALQAAGSAVRGAAVLASVSERLHRVATPG